MPVAAWIYIAVAGIDKLYNFNTSKLGPRASRIGLLSDRIAVKRTVVNTPVICSSLCNVGTY